jgi:predicted HD superfamily hydrolase involved in NAD metabolism
METKQRIEILKKSLSEKRFNHSIEVMKIAVKLAEHYKADVSAAETAGLLHDCAREIRGNLLYQTCQKLNIKVDYVTKAQPELLHGIIGVYVAKEKYEVTSNVILDPIRWHTTGREKMTLLDKIIYISDFIEPGRIFEGVDEVRKIVFKDLDKAMLMALDRTIKYVMMREVYIHPETIKARNGIISDIRSNKENGG